MGQRAGVVFCMAWVLVFFAFAMPAGAEVVDDDLVEPSQANLAVAGDAPPRDLVSFSERVWFDVNVDTVVDPGESPISIVRVELFADVDGDGWADDTDGDSKITLADALAVTTTDADGRFVFNSLDPGSYVAGIPSSEWSTGSALNGLLPSSPSPCQCVDGYVFSATDFGFWEPVFNLGLTKTVIGDGAPVTSGAMVTFSIDVVNQGSVAVGGLSIVDRIPTGLSLADGDWAQQADGSALIELAGVALAPGASTTVEITMLVGLGAGAEVINTASITTAQPIDTAGFALRMPDGSELTPVADQSDMVAAASLAVAQPGSMLAVTGTSVTDLIVYGLALVMIGAQVIGLAVSGKKLEGNPFRL